MNSRERTLLSLDFQEPDRVPVDLWMSPGFAEKLTSALNTSVEAFLDSHDVDLRYIAGPSYIGPSLRTWPDGSDEDIWGVRRRAVEVRVGNAVERYKEVVQSPLASATSVEQINDYEHWPSADWLDYSGIEAQCDVIRNQGRVAVFMGDRLNRIAQLKPAMYIRGVEQILLDMTLMPELARAVFENIRRFYCAYADSVLKAANGKLDIVLMGDDFGAQNGPLLSPEMWVDFLGDGFSEYADIAKSHSVRVMHHTCGGVRPIVPLMLERGLDVLQSLQPEAAGMQPGELKAQFGDRLAFQGGISVQRTLPLGTPEDVRAEVRDRVEALAPGGGYIFGTSHNIQADTPVENALELLKAYKEYGRYAS